MLNKLQEKVHDIFSFFTCWPSGTMLEQCCIRMSHLTTTADMVLCV
jgi:hypothetical protein